MSPTYVTFIRTLLWKLVRMNFPRLRLISRKRANKSYWAFFIQIFLRNSIFCQNFNFLIVIETDFWKNHSCVFHQDLAWKIDPDEFSVNRSGSYPGNSNKSSKFLNFVAGRVQKWTWKRIQIWFQLNVTLNMQIFTALVLTNTISWI